jgi:hypothetical protein
VTILLFIDAAMLSAVSGLHFCHPLTGYADAEGTTYEDYSDCEPTELELSTDTHIAHTAEYYNTTAAQVSLFRQSPCAATAAMHGSTTGAEHASAAFILGSTALGAPSTA